MLGIYHTDIFIRRVLIFYNYEFLEIYSDGTLFHITIPVKEEVIVFKILCTEY